MNTNRFSRCIFALLGCLLIFLLAACGETGVNPPSTGSPTSTANPSKTPLPGSSPTITTAPVPPTQTSCPPAGTVRAAVIAPLALGKDANIVYLVTEYNASSSTSASTLKRFDVTTGAKTEILKVPGVTFGSPQ